MPSLEAVLADIKSDIVSALAPYQPNIPPQYPNSDPRAGTIAATLVTTGEPRQYSVMERLENHYCQVAVYTTDGKWKPMPYTNNKATAQSALTGTPPSGTYYRVTGRATKDVYVDVWAYDKVTRDAIGEILRQHFGDYYRITNAVDGGIELLRLEHVEDEDSEQLDSVYVRGFTFNVDWETTEQFSITQVVETTVTEHLPDGSTVSENNP